ncbi:unnamed protein product, partial [Cladocopium goreaui]
AYTAWCKSCGGEGDLYRGYCPSCWEKWEASNGGNHRWRIERCRIGQILFSHATIADTFTDGTPLQDTVDLLLANPWVIEKIPYINVVDDGDRHISMDNRRLYAFRMAFDDDNYEVPIKRFASKEDYGAADFHRKATSVCGGHSVELRHHHTVAPHIETLNPPRTAKRFLLQKWKEFRSSVGAVLSLQDGQVVISGSQRQAGAKNMRVEDGIKHYQRILSTFHCEAVDLKDVRAKDAVRSSFQRWQAESNYSTVDISFDNEWSESGELPLHLGGDAEEVAEVKGLVMDLVNAVARCWEALPLPPHMGGYFSRTLSGKLPGKFAVEDDILHIRGNAAEREKMKKALEDLLPTVLSKQLQVDDGRLRSMIIGKEGVNIKRLRQNTSVDVHVGKDPDTTVRIAGPTADVELVYSRLKASYRKDPSVTGETPAVASCREEHRQITKELRLLPHAGRFMWRRLKAIGCEAEAFLRIPREAENLVEIRGNQRQVDHAEELLQEALYLDFSLIKLRISKRLKSDVLLGKNGVHIKDIKGERDVEIQFEDSTDESSMQDCVVSGQPDDCKSVLDEMLRRLGGYEVVSMPVDSRTAGLIIGKGSAGQTSCLPMFE